MQIINKQAEKIQEMATVMQAAVNCNSQEDEIKIEYLSRLQTENKGLRELLGITKSMNSMLINTEKVEAGTQTENSEKPRQPEIVVDPKETETK